MKRRISGYLPSWLSTVLALTVLVVVSFAAGRLSATPLRQFEIFQAPALPPLAPIQDRETPGDTRELIPLPGPGQGERQSLGEGQSPTPAECPLYLYQDGELFSLQPGPSEGPLPGSGRGGPQELIPLEPNPPAPRLPPTPPTPPAEDEPKDII